jgi:hypothetical protein
VRGAARGWSSRSARWPGMLMAGGLAALIGSACASRPENQPPTAHLAAFPQTAAVGDSIRLDAGGSTDPDEDSRFLQVRWDLSGDGAWDTLFGTIQVRKVVYAVAGERTVRIEVRSSGGLTDTAELTLVITPAPGG